MTRKNDQDIETALLVLADEHGMYLYRSDAGWWVGQEYRYGDARHKLRGGAPSSEGFPTIREAVADAVARLTEDAEAEAEEARRRTERAKKLRASVDRVTAGSTP